MALIYILIDPSSKEVRYVGKTEKSKIGRRLQNHSHDKIVSHKSNWIQKLKRGGKLPKIEVVEEIESGDWGEAERWWISYLRSLGCRLTNADDGGSGGYPRSDATRKKLSDALKGRPVPEWKRKSISRALTGRVLPQAEKDKISASLTGRKMKPEWIKAWVDSRRAGKGWATLKGKKRAPFSAEWRAAIGRSHWGKKHSVETKKKMSAAHIGRKKGPFSEKHRAALSASHKRRHSVNKILEFVVDFRKRIANSLIHG